MWELTATLLQPMRPMSLPNMFKFGVDIPAGAARGGHAHKECLEVIIAASGSFTVTLDDGNRKQSYLLNRPDQGLLVNTGIWRTLENFSAGSVCLVLASELYEEADYIYDYDEFLKYARHHV